MIKCLVLGANGFIGSHLVSELARQGYAVRAFGRSHLQPSRHADSAPIEYLEGDFIHEGDVRAALEGCDICFHLISTTLPKSSNDDPVFDINTNIGGTAAMLKHALSSGVKKVVFLSSGGTVYGIPEAIPIAEEHSTNPICSYGISKLAIEKYLELYRHLYGLDYTVLRLSNPYGEHQRVAATQGAIAVFLNRALRNEPIEIWGDGSVVRDYIYIADVISAMMSTIDYRGKQHVFNIGAGKGKSINEILEAVEHVAGQKIDRRYIQARPFDVPTSILSVAKAREELGWSPRVGFEEGLARTARWIRETL